MKMLFVGALAASAAGCAGAPYVPPALPAATIPTVGVGLVHPEKLTADYTHRTPVEPDVPQGTAPADPGFARPRLGS